MTPHTWRLLLHTTGNGLVTYTLSSQTWDGPVRRSGGFELMSTCHPDELPSVLDQVADLVLHLPTRDA
jgi:hypothetical protein